MINNRQAGRRRGRNNNPRQGGGGNRGNSDSANRIDSRARGNATQLLEKYKNMARDAQHAGDRVNTEYYLQFADHYFRVLADNRARQEEQQQVRSRRYDEDERSGPSNGADDEDGVFSEESASGEDSASGENWAQDEDDRREATEQRPRPRRRTPREPRQPVADDDAREQPANGVDAAALPPAINRPSKNEDVARGDDEASEAAPKPRRGRRPRQPEAAE